MLGHWRGLHNRPFFFSFQKFEEKYFVEVNKTVLTTCGHIGTDKEYNNEDPKQAPELNGRKLCFLYSSNDIISGELDKNLPGCKKVSGKIEPEKKINDSSIEISENDGNDTEVDENSEYGVCSESG